MRKKTKKTETYASIRKKLYSALAMLLVSSIIMVSSTYAWFVLSTAPEVTGIQTQVGANGALEIALLDNQSWTDLTRLDMGDIDENGTVADTAANLTWGNLVNLESATYGLNKITLMPSRLNIAHDGSSEGGVQYSVNTTTMLKTPIYGEDGRVEGLDSRSAVALVYNNGKFDTEGHGVRAIGTAANMSSFQLGMNSARAQLATYTAAARTAASNTLNANGSSLANIVVQYAVNNKESGYTVDDIKAILSLAQGLQGSLTQLEKALRQVYAGYIATAESGVTSDTYQTALEAITSDETSLASLKTTYPNASKVIAGIDTYVDKLIAMQKTVQDAIADCTSKINAGGTYTWEQISEIVRPLANTNTMTVGGKTITQLKKDLKKEDGSINLDEAFKMVQNGIVIEVPTGSGILSDIADYVGDYTCKVTVRDITVGSMHLDSAEATMRTATTVKPVVYLTACSTALGGSDVSNATGSTALTDFFGYAIDLAFRTNAENSHLMLQTEPENRIYEGDAQNEALQGKGSYMTFRTESGLSATKMVKLMSGIRVVFMDGDQKVLAIAALDTNLGQDVYTVLGDTEQTETKMYAYLNQGQGNYQKSDLIDQTTYGALPQTSSVIFDKAAGTVTAKLYLRHFSMTMAGDLEAQHETGGITIGGNLDTAAITSLTPDTPQKVTALVYLDGSVVNNSMVAADSNQSMTGILNLQFSSDATLMPASNTKLQQGSGNTAQPGQGDTTQTDDTQADNTEQETETTE